MESVNIESQLLVVVGTLIEAAADKNEGVREAVAASLRKLSKKHPNEVLKNAVTYRKHNPKMSSTHLVLLLHTMEQICEQHLTAVDGNVVLQLIEFAVAEMTRSAEYIPDVQMPASGILVALGQKHCNEVMEGLLRHFQPGVVPHYSIVHTMGSLASANVFGIVPFIKATLGTMLPMLGMLRSDAMKQVFSFTLGKFSDAILDYVANIDYAPDPTVRKEAYHSEMRVAYDILVTNWLHLRDPKVLGMILQAMGSMFSLLPTEKVAEQIPRLIPTLLALYRRSMDPFPITQCLSSVLLGATDHKAGLEPLLDPLLSALVDQVCTAPDYAQPLAIKNHFEVLRCFDRIAGLFSDRVVDLLIQQLKNNNERERIKALFVATHLVNSSENLIKSRADDLVLALKHMLGEHSMKVKKVLLKTFVAFAYRGYLTGNSGKEFVEFIVRHCCPQSVTVTAVGPDDFSRTCADTLYLLASTVPQVEGTLWPLLLTCLLTETTTAACADVARCLAHLAARRREHFAMEDQDSSKTRYEAPSAYIVLGRCLALLGSPRNCNRGIYILSFLKHYAPNVSRHISSLWEQRIPELVAQLEGADEEWDDHVWDDLLLDLLSSTLRELDEEKWALGLGTKLMEQLPQYAAHPTERAMLYKCVAVTTCHTSDKAFVARQLDVTLAAMRQHSNVDSQACAHAVGICSRAHLEMVLRKLETLRKDELGRRPSRLLGFMKDVRQEGEVERARLTLLRCYGAVALEAPADELLPQLEGNIGEWVLQQLQSAKEVPVREATLQALGSVVESFHPNRNTLHILLHSRMQALHAVLAQLRTPHVRLFPTVLRVTMAFIKLPPSLTSEERVSVLKECFDGVYSATTVVPEGGKGDGEMVNGTEDGGHHVASSLTALGLLVQELVLDDVTPATLDDVFTLLEPWLISRSSQQRAAALETLNGVLDCYLKNMKFGYESPSKFGQTGAMLGRAIPRCTDPSLEVRRHAVNCVCLVLCLAGRYEGHLSNYDNDLVSILGSVQDQIQTHNPKKLFKVTGDLAKMVCTKLPQFQLLHFVDSLLDGLSDAESSSSSGTSVVLNILLKNKGGELYHQAGQILNSILKQLTNVQCIQTRTGSVRAVLALASHHPKAVVSALLLQPIPYEPAVSECWWILAQDPVLSADIVEQFLRLVASTPLYEDQHDKTRIAVLLPLSAISALQDMFHVVMMQDLAIKRFPELFSMFLIAMGCYVGVSPPINTPQQLGSKERGFVPNRNAYKLHPGRVAQEAFKSFLLCSKCDAVAESLLQCTHTDIGENLNSFVAMVPALAQSACVSMPQSLPRLVSCLSQYGTSTYEPQRITVAAFYAELVNQCCNGHAVLVDSVVTNLLTCLTDPSPLVRQLCLKGLAAVAHLESEQRTRHTESVVQALVQGLDDHDPISGSHIALEAMRGFSQMLPIVDESLVQSVQVTVALRIKPYFEMENPALRTAALQMFGDLAGRSATSKAAFQEQITGNLVCMLLHLNDEDQDVVRASKYALRQSSHLLAAERINTMVQGHLIDSANLHYSDFIADLVKILVEELPEQVPFFIMNTLSYIRSSWPVIRGNAAMFIGLLYGNLPADDENKVPLDTVCARLIHLLRDEHHGVRTKAAHALSALFIT